MTARSYVVTGGAQGVGRAVVERLPREGHVVVLDVTKQLDWATGSVELMHGDAGDPDVAVGKS